MTCWWRRNNERSNSTDTYCRCRGCGVDSGLCRRHRISDDSDSEPEQPLVALADEDQEETSELDELFEGLFEGFLGDGGSSSEIPDRVLDLLDLLRSDLIAPDRDDFRPREREPFDEPGNKAPKEKAPKDKAPKGKAPKDGRDDFDPDGPTDRRPFGGFAFPDGRDFPFFGQGFPFGAEPFGDFFADGRLSPEEARELEPLFQEGFAGDIFRFEVAPPETDRIPPGLPDALLEGLGALPFREFFADGELTPREREALCQGLNEWLDSLFERLDQRG